MSLRETIYSAGPPPVFGTRALGLFLGMHLTLPYVRHNLPQELLAEVYGLFVFGGVVGGACRLVEVVVVRWSLRRPVWMRLRMV
ncbi:hypothetical protein BKH20_12510 [Actinomyces oris]|uniref:Uncharacterized protein n=1 Tax=Actinomyces oris TaxID=544580 RepID=A0A1Q8WJ43_9ACTO|nr:hypothetical protein BKH20_12510 [Actinomyces oris]